MSGTLSAAQQQHSDTAASAGQPTELIMSFSSDLQQLDLYAFGPNLTLLGYPPGATIEYDSRITWADAVHIATVEHPTALSDYAAIARLPCVERDTVFRLLTTVPRHVQYRGQHCRDDDPNFPGVWTPNIDTLLLSRAVLESHGNHQISGRCIEVGCGNGFISQVLLAAIPQLSEMHLLDTNPLATDSAADRLGHDTRCGFHVGMAQDVLKGLGKFDLVVCNPPYIPHNQLDQPGEYKGVTLTDSSHPLY